MRTTPAKDTSSWREGTLMDDLQDAYVDWRESAQAVTDAYDRWSLASGRERATLLAAYTATLDQEQTTATAYADAVTELERWLERSNARRTRHRHVGHGLEVEGPSDHEAEPV